ncbi:uncharacterized protein [Drosophila takahashii]|uniref:uncharacterized protein isoform X1 n=1 Tax=Drosophila takahashii TaxID=29030 RepID=UPI001CF847FC|nr:uncharacterized protein LOC108064913 isoform X1 [Drosophila takahashii]
MDFRGINKLNWRLHLSNNNNLVDYSAENRFSSPDAANECHQQLCLQQVDCGIVGATTMGSKQKRAATTPAQAVVADDENDLDGAVGEGEDKAGHGATTKPAEEGGDKMESAAYYELNVDVAGCGLAAIALSPIEAAAGGLSSSRTSVNNSTENLSYASDNFYGDDLILLDDVDVDAEEISINSDDCVYAYRGDRADFDMDLETTVMGRGGRHHLDLGRRSVSGVDDSLICVDDETEFLEMDFDPDPSSELEFTGRAQDLGVQPQANLLLMQRDYSQMSGKVGDPPAQARQLHCSPIDDFPQEDELPQQKHHLSKKFARINLNLDQIKDGVSSGNGGDHNLDKLMGAGVETEVKATEGEQSFKSSLAHSLPNTLYAGASFGRSTSVPSKHPEPKLTGAKPKRPSHSSSVMSKSSSSYKSRRTQTSTTFDERCYSCTDFRATSLSSCQHQQLGSGTGQDQMAPMLMAAAAVVAMASSSSCMAHFDLSGTEDNCLDCLEKEFLANTIGKALDPRTCPKCRRPAGGRGSSLSLYARADQTSCRSGSPVHFDGSLLGAWHISSTTGMVSGPSLGPPYHQRINSCDTNFNGLQLLNQTYSTEPLVISLSTGKTCDEEHVLQALDKLHVTYDRELLHDYFNILGMRRQANSSVNLKQLLIQASKRQGNHRKLKRLIEIVTQQQLIVQFKRKDEVKTELVPIMVADILKAWNRCRDLSILLQLDGRFHSENVMGKIGHIVREATVAASSSAQAASSSLACKRPLPEFLMIPQYYESGELTLTRK